MNIETREGAEIRVANLTRVSLKNGSQNPMNQLNEQRNECARRGWKIVDEYIDTDSGSNGDRPEFLRMLADADQHKFDLLLIWSLDRFSREGISNVLGYIKRLQRAGVAIKSLTEPWLDTSDEGTGSLLLAIFSWVAQQERCRIIERTNAGLARARAEGKRLGRPHGSKDKRPRRRSGYHLRYAGK